MVPGYPNMRTISHSFSPIPTITYSLSLQCDQIGRFLKVLGNKFSFKSSPKVFCDFWALLKNITFLVKSSMVNFWATFGTSWATFYFSTWSHCLSLSHNQIFSICIFSFPSIFLFSRYTHFSFSFSPIAHIQFLSQTDPHKDTEWEVIPILEAVSFQMDIQIRSHGCIR